MHNLQERIQEEKQRIERHSQPYEDVEHKSEMGNFHAGLKQQGKKKGAEKVLHFLEQTVPILMKHKLSVTEFNSSSFRITDGVKTVDYYPKKNRLFIHGKNWKDVKGDVKSTILKGLQ